MRRACIIACQRGYWFSVMGTVGLTDRIKTLLEDRKTDNIGWHTEKVIRLPRRRTRVAVMAQLEGIEQILNSRRKMAIYHITSGCDDAYGTFCFIKAPEGQQDQIEEALKAYAKEHLENQKEYYKQFSILKSAFVAAHGEILPFLPKFGVLHPEYPGVLALGKTHIRYEEAKKAQENFLLAKNQRDQMRADYLKNCDEYVKQHQVVKSVRLTDFLQSGWRMVEVLNIHIDDLD